MSEYVEKNERGEFVSLLPFGETLRPLISSNSVAGADLRFVLQRRGIFIKNYNKQFTVPLLASILLSPKEFDALKNRQQIKEKNIKISDATTTWNSEKTVVQALPEDLENTLMRDLTDENSSYQITKCLPQPITPNELSVSIEIKRRDWTKDVLSSTSEHKCAFTISKPSDSDVVTYHKEITTSETKELLNKIQNTVHNYFQSQGVVEKSSSIQKILAYYFDHSTRFDFLSHFIKDSYPALKFKRIINIDAGVDSSQSFPEHFKWLKDNIDRIALYGNKLQETDIITLSKLGVLVFGDIDAEFDFDYKDAKGTCVIKYGFPDYSEGKTGVEFEVKINDSKLRLHPNFAHVSKENVKRYLLKEFQQNKHVLFDQFKSDGRVDTRKRDLHDQYEFEYSPT